MKKTIKTLIIVFMLISFIYLIGNAQPYPPSDPEGDPVPVENLIWILIPVIMYLGAKINHFNRKK